MRIVLHIGSEKTGSTSIQGALDQQRDSLREQGIFVPNWSNAHAGCHMVLPLMQGEAAMKEPFFAGNTKPFDQVLNDIWQEWAEIEGQVKAARPDVLVLTSETLFRPLKAEGDRFVARLKALSSEIEIVCYLRAPYSFAVSWASQTLKQFGTVESAVLATMMAYEPVLNSYASEFDGNIRAFAYGASRADGGSGVDAFFEDVLGVPAPPQAKSLFWNVTPTPEGQVVLQDYYLQFYGRDRWRHTEQDFRNFQAVLHIEEKLGLIGKSAILTPVAQAWIQRHCPDLDAIEAQFGVKLNASGLEPVFDPSVQVPERLGLRDIFVLDPDAIAALKAQIEQDMPAFHASSGSSLRARLMRTKIKLSRRLRGTNR